MCASYQIQHNIRCHEVHRYIDPVWQIAGKLYKLDNRLESEPLRALI